MQTPSGWVRLIRTSRRPQLFFLRPLQTPVLIETSQFNDPIVDASLRRASSLAVVASISCCGWVSLKPTRMRQLSGWLPFDVLGSVRRFVGLMPSRVGFCSLYFPGGGLDIRWRLSWLASPRRVLGIFVVLDGCHDLHQFLHGLELCPFSCIITGIASGARGDASDLWQRMDSESLEFRSSYFSSCGSVQSIAAVLVVEDLGSAVAGVQVENDADCLASRSRSSSTLLLSNRLWQRSHL